MDELEKFSPPQGTENQANNNEYGAEKLPASLLSKERLLKGAENLTAGVQEQIDPKRYYIAEKKIGFDDPEAGMSVDVITYPRSTMSYGLAAIDISRNNPDGGKNIVSVTLEGSREDPTGKHPTAKLEEFRLSAGQVEAGVTHRTIDDLLANLPINPDELGSVQDLSHRLMMTEPKVVRTGELMEADAQQVALALGELQRRHAAGEITAR